MMRFANLILCLLWFANSVWAANVKPQKTWGEKVIEVKQCFADEVKEQFVSKVFKKGDEPEKISVDISKFTKLVLITDGTADGSNYDHTVWADAKLITADGKEVYLDELKFTTAKAGYGKVILNQNLVGKKISLQSKKFEKGVFVHANGEILIELDRKYARFEAIIGIDDGSNNVSSARFLVQNAFSNQYVADLTALFPKRTSSFLNLLKDHPAVWLNSKTDACEEQVCSDLIDQLEVKENFQNRFEQIQNLKADERELAYLDLFEKVREVYFLQEDLVWVKPESIRLAFDQMKKESSLDTKAIEPKVEYIENEFSKAKLELYSGSRSAIEKVEKIIRYKREILLANPLLDFDKIVAVRYKLGKDARKKMAPAIGTQQNNWSSHMSMAKKGFDCELVELSNLRGDVKVKSLYKHANSSAINCLKMHWDADRLLFSGVNENNTWQIFEMDMKSNQVQQLTQLPEKDLNFFDAAYLPNGKIVASSNIAYQGVPCVNSADIVGSFCLYDPKTKGLRRISFGQENDWCPEVMNNGRLMQLRWEYSDITHYFSRIMLHMNPDGTNKKELYGSGSYWPNSLFDAKPLPGKNNTQFIGIVSGHHGVARSGRLIMFDPKKGRSEASGVMQEIPHRNKKVVAEVKDKLVNGIWPQFIKPQVLSKDYFLVTAKLDPHSLWGIYLVDVFDNVSLIAEFKGEGLNEAIPVYKKETPPIIPEKVNLDKMESTVYIQDIYTGQGGKGIKRGTIKQLRIFTYEFAYAKSPSGHMVQGIQAGWDMKRILGTVPVEEDGSVIFKIPSNIPISMQPLDENGAAVQLMRSWITGMPGEVISCTGCHENQNTIAQPKFTLASRKTPIQITPPKGGVRAFTFDLEVQPILDRKCTICHDGIKAKPNFKDSSLDKVTGFSKSYLALHPFVHRQGPEGEMPVTNAMEYHVSNSELIQRLNKGHKNVELSDEELRVIYEWIDLNVPYHGTFKVTDKCGCNPEKRRNELMQKYANTHVDWKKELDDYVKFLNKEEKVAVTKPKPLIKTKTKKVTARNWPFNQTEAREKQAEKAEFTKVIQLKEGISLRLKYIPAGSFVMGSNTGDIDAYPPSKQAVKKGFWMSEYEITNEQMRVFFPEHDSRYQVQFWKDHTTPGYPANDPNQPVIRVSWEDAVEFCEKLSAQTGMKVTLPTESQWEWGARAGSNTDFWYGDQSVGFGAFENFADMQLADMAVSGVDPKPMSKNNKWRPYFDYIPRSQVVDDGSMLAVKVGSYQSNPWGLFDMLGNVSEWTRSDFKAYPYKEKDGRNEMNPDEKKVVRGGSWKDRSHQSTSYYRRAFEPWQKMFNVGFRIVVEE